MNYSAGDKVMCIDATDTDGAGKLESLEVGAVYVVGFTAEICVGIVGDESTEETECQDCGVADRFKYHHWPWRFVKLDGVLEDTQRMEDRRAAEAVTA